MVRRFMKLAAAIILLVFLAMPVLAQEKKAPQTLDELKKDHTIVSLRIENMELRYQDLKALQKRLKDHIIKLEAEQKKAKKPKVDAPKPK